MPNNNRNNPVRQLLDEQPIAIDGWLSYENGLCPPRPLAELPANTPFRLWETWARTLPILYQTGRYHDFFTHQPVVSTEMILNKEILADADLLRANQILGLCAHAAVHFSAVEEDSKAPSTCTGPESTSSNGHGTTAVLGPIQGGWLSNRPTTTAGAATTTNPPTPLQCPFKPSSVTAAPMDKTGGGSATTPTNGRCKKESRIPAAILEPWKAVNTRLGRPMPTFTYYDYFTLNVTHRHEPRECEFGRHISSTAQHAKLRCDIAVFGDKTENVFVVMNYDMEYQSIPLVRLACEATDCIIQQDPVGLTTVLFEMGNVVAKVTEAFLHADPNTNSDVFCDPVAWSKSIGILIPPILDGEMSMSGLQSSFSHLVDALIGRHEFTGELGDLANNERPWLPSLHQEFFRRLSQVSIRSFVLSSNDGNLHGSFNRLVRLFVHGFLDAHRIKMMGFLELGIKTGRSQSSGQTAQAAAGWQGRVWRKVNEDCLHSMAEREQLQTRPDARGFTSAFVESITRVTPEGESYKIVFNTVGRGIRYEAGDRVEVLPRNPPGIVKRMLVALQAEGGFIVPVVSPEWQSAVEQHYPDMGHQPVLPIASLLKITTLRPLSKTVIAQVCKGLSVNDDTIALEAFRAGKLDDVPDLIELLRQSCGCAMSATAVVDICSVLSPLLPRLYSVANAPSPDEDCQASVSIVISQIWYQATSVAAEEKCDDRLGVATSCLLNDSLYNYIPIRIVEAEGFHLPVPTFHGSILSIALGSGASPMFAFIEELLNRKKRAPAVQLPEVFFCWGLAKPTDLFCVPLLEEAIRTIGLKLYVSFSTTRKSELKKGRLKL
jgi:hypothetical protein